MPTMQHTRPFNLEHARAGAPIACANGDEVDILKWDRKHTLCILGLARQDAAVRVWRADGSYIDANSKAFPLVMTPLGFIEDKPVFVGDELVTPTGMQWIPTPTCRVERSLGDCRWPAPAPVYPETRMPASEIHAVYLNNKKPTYYAGLTAVANAALRHAIDAGQVVLPGEAYYFGDVKNDYKLYGDRASVRACYDRAIELSKGFAKASDALEAIGWHLKDGEWVAPLAVGILHLTGGFSQSDMEAFKARWNKLLADGDAWKMPILVARAETVPKDTYDQCQRDLGKAEQLLEALGYRSADNGEWQAPELGTSINLEGIGVVRGNIDAINYLTTAVFAYVNRAARDMAIAEAVLDHVAAKLGNNIYEADGSKLVVKLHFNLATIVAGVKS